MAEHSSPRCPAPADKQRRGIVIVRRQLRSSADAPAGTLQLMFRSLAFLPVFEYGAAVPYCSFGIVASAQTDNAQPSRELTAGTTFGGLSRHAARQNYTPSVPARTCQLLTPTSPPAGAQ